MVCVAAGRQQTKSQVQGLGDSLRNSSVACAMCENQRFGREGEALASDCKTDFG